MVFNAFLAACVKFNAPSKIITSRTIVPVGILPMYAASESDHADELAFELSNWRTSCAVIVTVSRRTIECPRV